MNNYQDNKELTFEDYEKSIYFQLLINSLIFANSIKHYMQETKIDTIDKTIIFQCLYDYLIAMKDVKMFNKANKNNLYFLFDYLDDSNNKVEQVNKNKMLNDMRKIVRNLDDDNLDFLCEQIILRDFGVFNYKKGLRRLKRMEIENILSLEKNYYQSISNDFPIFSLLGMNDEFYFKCAKNFILLKDFYRSINYFLVVFPDLFLNPKYLSRVKDIITNDDIQKNNSQMLEYVDDEFLHLSNLTKRLVKNFERKIR